MDQLIPLPAPLRKFFTKFPLYTYPPVPLSSARRVKQQLQNDSKATATLWISPPTPDIVLPSTNLLSADVECLKWQAYLALRGVTNVGLRWDVAPEGGVDGRLPCLHVHAPSGSEKHEVLGARMIPGWADDALGVTEQDELEGYRDAASRDESRAWVALLEGVVHAALALVSPPPLSITALLLHFPTQPEPSTTSTLATHLAPPPAPLTGFSSLLPPYGTRVDRPALLAQYRDGVVALADRLGQDEWFLGSRNPTPLDALVFAYIHTLLAGPDDVRIDVARRANLVTWERRVRVLVQSAFVAV